MTDLDARVAALMRKVAYYRYAPIEVADKKIMEFEQAIRAELQKPALHEPCTWEEAARAWHLHTASSGSPIDCMLVAINSVLQSRTHHMSSEPARINYYELQAIAEEYKLPFNAFCAAIRKFLQGRAKPVQEEITDAERYQFASKRLILAGGHVFGWPIAPATKAEWDMYLDKAIRASKGEKT